MGFGGAVGAQEQSACMIRGKITDYETMLGSEAWLKMPMMNTRTVLVYKPDWA